MLGPEFPRDKWLCPQQNWGYPPGIPHPLLSDPWFAERIDKAVQKGALHERTGGRKKSRAARIRAGA